MDQNQSVLNEDRDNVQLVETDDAFPTLDAMLPWEMVVPNELLVPPHAEAPSPEYQASASLPWEPVNSVELRFTPPPRREVNLPSWLKPEEATSALALSGGALLAMIDLDSLVEAESRAFSPNRQSSDDDPVQRTLW